MVPPPASRPGLPVLAALVAVALATLAHPALPHDHGGVADELLHLSLAPGAAALLALVLGRGRTTASSLGAAAAAAALGHEAAALVQDGLLRHGDVVAAAGHLAHAAVPAVGLLVLGLLAVAGVSHLGGAVAGWCAALAAHAPTGRAASATVVLGGVVRRPRPPLAGRRAGRAPPRPVAA